jgi:hypothetical protein
MNQERPINDLFRTVLVRYALSSQRSCQMPTEEPWLNARQVIFDGSTSSAEADYRIGYTRCQVPVGSRNDLSYDSRR